MSVENLSINPGPDSKLSIGNQVIELKDESKKVFTTDNMLAFEAFCTGRQGEVEIYYSATELNLVPTKAERNFKPLAKCTLKPSAFLEALSAGVNKDLSIVEFEKLLTSLRRFALGSHMIVLSNLRAFTVAKKQTYERSVDNSGNYKLLMQRETSQGDWLPPEKMSFKVPLFAFLPEEIEVIFDLIFTVTDDGAPKFRLENLNYSQEILDRRVVVLDARLADKTTCPKYWGSYEFHALTDTWRYQENKASL